MCRSVLAHQQKSKKSLQDTPLKTHEASPHQKKRKPMKPAHTRNDETKEPWKKNEGKAKS
jgi:hypothetical protein